MNKISVKYKILSIKLKYVNLIINIDLFVKKTY